MKNFEFRRIGVSARLWAIALVLAVSTAHAQLTTPVQFTTAGNGQHEGRCEPFTGCNNIDTWQTLIKRNPLFVGQPTMTVTGITVQSFQNSFSSATFSNVRITLGTRTADSLGANFASNLSNAQVVFQGPLTLTSSGGLITLPVTTPYVYSPGLNGNLVVWWQNLGGEGKGAIAQFVDFEGGVNSDSITAYFLPNNTNGGNSSNASAPTANRFLAKGPVTRLTATIDQTNLTNIYAPAGGGTILNTPHIKKSTALAQAGTFSVEACLVRDPRFSQGAFNAKVQTFSGLQPVLGSCGFLATSPLRFPKWLQAAAPGRLPGDTQSYHYIGITHAVTSGLTLDDVIVTDQSDLVTGLFGVVYDSPGAGVCSDSNIFRRPLAVGGEATAQANTDVRPTYWQCNDLRSGTRGTDIVEGVVQTETSNDDTYVIQQLKNELNALVSEAGTCVSTTTNALQELAIIQSRQAQLHNAFVQDDFKAGYQLAENIAFHNESIAAGSFAACATQNLGGAITAISITIAMSVWDRHYWGADYHCYKPKTRSDAGLGDDDTDFTDLVVFAGFENTCQ